MLSPTAGGRLIVVCRVAAIVALAFGLQGRAVTLADEHHIKVLGDNGIEANAESIGAYLNSLQPTPEAVQRYASLVQQLGDDEFFRREAAMQQLLRSPVSSVELLQKAAQGDDPEIAYRAKVILETANQNREELLHAAFAAIRERNIKGLTDAVLKAIPYCPREYLKRAAAEALKSTSQRDDVGRLREALKSDRIDVRIAAIGAIGSVSGTEAGELLRGLLDDPQTPVQLAAARALADRGERSSLPALVKLLGAAEQDVRVRSVQTLRASTGRKFGYRAYDDPPKRRAAIQRWLAWVQTDGQTAKLTFPIRAFHVEVGRTLICLATQHRVIELDENGKIVWEQGNLKYPWRAAGLPSGHRLVASHSGKFAAEFDARGKEIWRIEGLPGGPHSIERLDNGNTLMACSDSHKVLEITPDLKTAWSIHIDGRPTDARRLEDGRTLIVLKNAGKVVEVDRSGKVLWKIEGLRWPNTAQRLDNGNTLIAEVKANRVVEFNREGKVAWSKDGITQPFDAQRLANGHTLIAQNSLATMVDRDGKVVWSYPTKGDTRITRY